MATRTPETSKRLLYIESSIKNPPTIERQRHTKVCCDTLPLPPPPLTVCPYPVSSGHRHERCGQADLRPGTGSHTIADGGGVAGYLPSIRPLLEARAKDSRWRDGSLDTGGYRER